MVYTVGMFYPLVARKEAIPTLTIGSRHEPAVTFFGYPGILGY